MEGGRVLLARPTRTRAATYLDSVITTGSLGNNCSDSSADRLGTPFAALRARAARRPTEAMALATYRAKLRQPPRPLVECPCSTADCNGCAAMIIGGALAWPPQARSLERDQQGEKSTALKNCATKD
eukprot:8188472-Pyramimonas_sp.AAC.1